jgi:hypothetical protein
MQDNPRSLSFYQTVQSLPEDLTMNMHYHADGSLDPLAFVPRLNLRYHQGSFFAMG